MLVSQPFSISLSVTAMSSPVPDDYASLVYPWNPLTESASKNVGSARDMVENHRDTKVRNLAGAEDSQDHSQTNVLQVGDAAATDSVGAHKCLHGDTQVCDTGKLRTGQVEA